MNSPRANAKRPEFLIVTAVLAVLLSDIGSAESLGRNSQDFSKLDSHIETMVHKYALRGASIILENITGRIYTNSYGDWTTKTTVAVASACKILSAVAIMRLIEKGQCICYLRQSCGHA